ncbi:MAG: heavy metal-responsive transcriptional regulator [Candidatus Omnitrophica bacterium CG11_big_fil_rev_8_21_14_0_20_63_9]|nr:MAG: heavy metal-responsive transcriptional regulator [Candidatus Omnitrophica bacterium CG11_big_fil_rev_8_21_14_0_20_63_9]
MTSSFIGTIAKQASVPIKTIRYYEDVGLLPKPARTVTRYRLYSPEVVDRLQFIKKAQSLGLRLDDIKEILDLADRGRCPCGHVQRVLQARRQELRRKIEDLRLVERRIAKAVQTGCPRNFKPRGKALCPTIDRQRIAMRSR